MNWALGFIRELCLALWLGGLFALDCVETPIRFRTPGITKEQATAIGSRVFSKFGQIQIWLGVLSILICALMISRHQESGPYKAAIIVCIASMLLIAISQSAFISPRLLAGMAATRDIPYQKRHVPFASLHKAYIVCDVLKLLLGAVALLMISRPSSTGL